MNGIELTEGQLADCAAERAGWLEVARSTERCDRPAAERAVRTAYATAGLPVPRRTVWMSSPLGGAVAVAALAGWSVAPGVLAHWVGPRAAGRVLDELDRQLGGAATWHPGRATGPDAAGELWRSLRTRLRRELGQDRAELLWERLGAEFDGARLGGLLWRSFSGPLRAHLAGRLRDPAADPVRTRLAEAVDPWAEAYLLARHRQAFAAAGLEVPERLAAMDAAVRRTGWWWPLPDAVVLTERPTAVHHDRLGRLHAADGPALAWADGVEVHAWRGTPVPADLVEGDGWAVPRVLAEPDAELRRCAVERRGWDRFVTEAGLPQVGPAEPDPGNPGRELRLHELPAGVHGTAARVLICENGSPDPDGTHRRFGLPVPLDVPDPTSAAAWTYGIEREEYAGVQRRT